MYHRPGHNPAVIIGFVSKKEGAGKNAFIRILQELIHMDHTLEVKMVT